MAPSQDVGTSFCDKKESPIWILDMRYAAYKSHKLIAVTRKYVQQQKGIYEIMIMSTTSHFSLIVESQRFPQLHICGTTHLVVDSTGMYDTDSWKALSTIG